MGIKQIVKDVLIGRQNKLYEAVIAQKKLTYGEWITEKEKTERADTTDKTAYTFDAPGAGDSFFSGAKKSVCTEDFVIVECSTGRRASGLEDELNTFFAQNPDILIAYGDEDVWREGSSQASDRNTPWFKPEWSPDFFESCFYFGSLTVVKRKLWEQAAGDLCEITDDSDFAGKKMLIKRCVELAGGYERGSRAIGHIPSMVFHVKDEDEWDKFFEDESENLIDINEQTEEYTFVSIIIPSKDNPDILKNCIISIKKVINFPIQCEVVVVDNGSMEENRKKIEEFIEELKDDSFKIKYIYEESVFNFSYMCNVGARNSSYPVLLFLNDDVELCKSDCISEMAALAYRKYTGAVGMKLYYPDSIRIQHAGITNLPMGPVHKLQFLEDNREYYFGMNRGKRNVLAVTAACLMVSREKFDSVGGFCEELRVAFNDVDFCFSLYEKGCHNLCMNDCYAYHHESLSRGDDESAQKLQRLLLERDRLYERHRGLEGFDPYYPGGLSREELDTRVRYEYEVAKNTTQKTAIWKRYDISRYKKDDCLLFRVESSVKNRVIGYGVVLGDDNSCYTRMLILIDDFDDSVIYCAEIQPMYRPDLIENMPDQKNTGLCGFDIDLDKCGIKEEVKSGRYQVGMAVKSRVSSIKIYNVSNRYLEI